MSVKEYLEIANTNQNARYEYAEDGKSARIVHVVSVIDAHEAILVVNVL
jgi:hypothetical protein